MLICRDSISVCPVLVKSVQLCFQPYPYGCSSPATKVHVDDTLTAATTTAIAAVQPNMNAVLVYLFKTA